MADAERVQVEILHGFGVETKEGISFAHGNVAEANRAEAERLVESNPDRFRILGPAPKVVDSVAETTEDEAPEGADNR